MKKILLITIFLFSDRLPATDFETRPESIQERQVSGQTSNKIPTYFMETQVAKPIDTSVDTTKQSNTPVATRVNTNYSGEIFIAQPVSDKAVVATEIVPLKSSEKENAEQIKKKINISEYSDETYKMLVKSSVQKINDNNTPGGLLASASKSSLGNSEYVLVDFNSSAKKFGDSIKAIQDFSVAVDTTAYFINEQGQVPYRILKDSVNAFTYIAEDPLNRISEKNRDQAIDQLTEKRKVSGSSYHESLTLLKSSATKEQIAQAKNVVQTKIGNKNSDQLFNDSGIEGSYDDFMKDLVGIKDPKQLSSFLETKLNLKPGELSASPISIKTSMKLEDLYRSLDLIAAKKGSNISGSVDTGTFMSKARGSRLTNADQIKSLMSEIRRVEPTVRTLYENELLIHSTDKQSVLLLTQLDSIYSVMGKAMKQLQAISFTSAAIGA